MDRRTHNVLQGGSTAAERRAPERRPADLAHAGELALDAEGHLDLLPLPTAAQHVGQDGGRVWLRQLPGVGVDLVVCRDRSERSELPWG